MTLLICWILFPLLLGVLCLGCGALIEALAGDRLPAALVAPAGLAVIVVVMVAAVSVGPTISLATPAVVALAVAGLADGPAPRPWALWGPGPRARPLGCG